MSVIIQGVINYEIKQLADNMSDEELYAFCQANPDLRIERDDKGNLIIMSPVGPKSGYYEGEFMFYLKAWNKEQLRGIAFSSSTGFIMPNGAMRSPDASWMSIDKWRRVEKETKDGFPKTCPEFVSEIRSKTDPLNKVKEKMQEWINNGARLAWLIDPWEEKAYIYRADGSIEIVNSFEHTLSGEEVLKGFELELSKLRLPE